MMHLWQTERSEKIRVRILSLTTPKYVKFPGINKNSQIFIVKMKKLDWNKDYMDRYTIIMNVEAWYTKDVDFLQTDQEVFLVELNKLITAILLQNKSPRVAWKRMR